MKEKMKLVTEKMKLIGENMKLIMHDKKKRAQLLLIIASAVILMGTVTFAYFTATANNNNPAKVDATTAFLKLRFADGDNGISGTIDVGETVTKKFLIENVGTAEASLSIDWVDMINTYMADSLSYRLTYSETENGEYQELLPYSNIPTSSDPLKQTLAGEVSVPAGETYYYNLDITYNDLPDVDQSPDIGATFSTVFNTGQPIKYRYYTLSVDPNGGELEGSVAVQEFLLQNRDTKEIGTPTREGYTFDGWEMSGKSSAFTDGVFTMGIGDTTLKARWNANKYTVTIDGEEQEINFGDTVELEEPSREGYTFAGWSASGGTVDGNTFTLTDADDISITPNWTVNSYNYTVIHRKMNVSGSGYTTVTEDTITKKADYGSKVTPPVNTYEGFTSPSTKEITIGTNESSNTVTYDYTRNQYTLTVNPDGGTYSGDTSLSLYYGATATIPNPSKTGHTFTNWSYSSGTLSGTTFTMGAGNATLTANYSINKYTYKVYHRQMNVNGSGYTVVTADTVSTTATYGTKITPPVHTYEGFTSPSAKEITIGTSESGNTVTYDYTRNRYTLTVKPEGGSYSGETSLTMYYGATTNIPNPTKSGTTFTNWTVSSGTLSGTTFTMGAADATLTANYSTNNYKYIVYHQLMNTNGVGYTNVDADTFSGQAAYGSVVRPDVKTYTGFTSPSRGSLTIQVDTDPPTKNILNYQYRRNQYTLTINPNGGVYGGKTTNTTASVYYNATYTLGTPTREGYTFKGWKNTGGSLSGSTFTMSGTSGATVTAEWQINKYAYKVYYRKMNVNGSGYTEVTADTISTTADYGTTITPTVKSYTGFTSPSQKSMVISTDTSANVIYYDYTRNKYNLTIDPNGGTYDGKTSTTTVAVYYGATHTLGTPTREGYTFRGWMNGSTAIDGSSYTMNGTSAVTLTAKWEVNKYAYKVYHRQMNVSGSGYTVVSSDTVSSTANFGSTVTPPVKSYTGFTSPTQKSMVISTNTSANEIYYDYTRNKYTLTINPNGGTYGGKTTNTTAELFYGATYTLSTPSRTGYNYSWSKSGGTLSGSTFTMGAGDATITASWTAKQFSVTFNANGGSPTTSSKTVSYDSTYGDLPTPTYAGYKFLGWFTAKTGGTKVTSETKVALSADQTLYAHWEELLMTVAYGLKSNKTTVTSYSEGVTTEMYAFEHEATTQTPVLTDYRYIGNSPNNYVTFNDESWRIVGIFPVYNSETGEYENRLKIVRNTLLEKINRMRVINVLNDAYYNRGSTTNTDCDHYDPSEWDEDAHICDFTTKGLNSTARAQIANSLWYLGGTSGSSNGDSYYNYERGTANNNSTLKVGLLYASDYLYSNGKGYSDNCFNNDKCYDSSSKKSWIYNLTNKQNTILFMYESSSNSNELDYTNGIVGSYEKGRPEGIFPAVYLKSNIEITGGKGTSGDPYTLSVPALTVTFDANGGTVSTTSKDVTYDSTYGDLPTPTYAGQKFLGWYTEQDGGTEVTSSTQVSITDDQTLYAHWEEALPEFTVVIRNDCAVWVGDISISDESNVQEYRVIDRNGTVILSGSRNDVVGEDKVSLMNGTPYTVVAVTKSGKIVQPKDTQTYCFVAGTKVLTETGLKNIEDIKAGEYVYTLDLDTNERVLNKVIAPIISKTEELYEITVDGEVIESTPRHEFYVLDKGWVRASDLEEGDVLPYTADGVKTISKIEYKKLDEPINVYNLTVENNHNYLITENEILVHNAGSCP